MSITAVDVTILSTVDATASLSTLGSVMLPECRSPHPVASTLLRPPALLFFEWNESKKNPSQVLILAIKRSLSWNR
jgi:hypothetical protein